MVLVGVLSRETVITDTGGNVVLNWTLLHCTDVHCIAMQCTVLKCHNGIVIYLSVS